MTGRRRSELVEARADLILSAEPSIEAYVSHFEAQMHRGPVRRLLDAGYRCLTRAGAFLVSADSRGVW